MSIYQDSKVDLLTWVNKKAGLTFLWSDFIFSTPAVNDNPATATKNTKMRATISPDKAGYKGTTILYYNRLNLSKLADFPVPDYPPTGGLGQSVYDLLPRIRNSMAIVILPEDLEETFVEDNGSNGRVLLKAKASSFGFTGQFYLTLAPKPPISGIFKSNNINWS